MSEREFWKSTFSGTIYEVVTEISDFVVVKHIGEDTLWRKCIMLETSDGQFVPDPTEIKVGDYVRPKETPIWDWYKVIHIHQEYGDSRRWIVYAFEGGIPRVSLESNLEKKLD